MPGSTTHVDVAVSTVSSRLQYLVQSMTTVALVACPARLVPTSAGEHRRAVLLTDPHRLHARLHGPRDDDADGNLPVVRGVGGVGAARPGVEADLPVHAGAEGSRQRPGRLPHLVGRHVDFATMLHRHLLSLARLPRNKPCPAANLRSICRVRQDEGVDGYDCGREGPGPPEVVPPR